MASFNKIMIVGYLGRDPEIRYTPQGQAVCNFSIATTERRKESSGDAQETTTWFRVTLWGRQAEVANQYLSKGKQVYVEGRLRQSEFTDRDGNKRTTLEVTASDIQFADSLGYRIKLVATIRANQESLVEVHVHPTLVPKQHVLASVNGVFNALMVRGDIVGDTLFYGRGAGQDPTTSSVISDLAQAAIWYDSGGKAFGFTPHGLYGKCLPIERVSSG